MEHSDAHTEQARANPLDAYFRAMEERIVGAVADALKASPALALDLAGLGLDPLRAYSAKEVAAMLGTSRVASVYEIAEEELPRVRRIGSAVGFLGINVLCYMHGLEPIDVAAVVERYRRRLLDERPSVVQPLRPGEPGKTRVL